jgi:hypothetical protein
MYIILFFLCFSSVLFSQSSEDSIGDNFYNQRKYNLAIYEYEKLVLKKPDDAQTKAKLAISYMRVDNYNQSVNYLKNENDFTHQYLRLFANMKIDTVVENEDIFFKISQSSIYTDRQKEKAKLLSGTKFLEDMKLQEAITFYRNLKNTSKEKDIKNKSQEILTQIDTYRNISRKSLFFGGGLSAILPGSGQIYSGQYVDGVLAFFFSSIFLGSAAYMNHLENQAGVSHSVSPILGIVGLFFYGSNIYGGINAAQRYNLYQERKFYQKIQDNFFNLNVIEKYSELKFNTEF